MEKPQVNYDVLHDVSEIAISALNRLVKDEHTWFTVTAVIGEWIWPASKSEPIRQICIKIDTNNRPMLMGQFLSFSKSELSGYHPNYLIGLIHGQIDAGMLKPLSVDDRIVLDVRQIGEPPADLYEIAPKELAIRRGALDPQSELATLMDSFQIKYVIMAGRILSGPSAGLMRVVARQAAHAPISRMLDVFAGSLSAARVALQLGISDVTIVDRCIHPNALENLGAYREKCILIECNVEKFHPQGFFDIAVMDPFQEWALDAYEIFLPNLIGHFGMLAINLGRRGEAAWLDLLISKLREFDLQVDLEDHGDETIAICTPQ